MEMPDVVKRSVATYLSEVDAAIPGLVQAAYVTGSVALGDFQAEISDVDLVAICANRPDDSQLKALATVHRPSHPAVDVLYVTWDHLQADPGPLSAPHSREGTFYCDGAFAANPVEWRTLQTRAIAVRGPKLAAHDVWFDPATLRRWNVRNLEDYWRGRLEWMRRLEPTEAVMRWEYGLQWLVLGVPRLHHTVATLEITSKTGAGHYALGFVADQWHPVIRTCIALREDRSATLTLPVHELRQDAVDLVAWLIDDAQRLAAS